ncbi:ribosome-associated translation inhibitor RaiA [Dolichospermum sp. ST_sed3]|nr:ribosome-associated translation inhibitor RaiA [Dolichospermum sp. ST_sed3]
MRHNIKASDFEMTPAIKSYVEKVVNHLDKFINLNDNELPMCYVEIGKTTNHHKQGELFKAEFTIHIGGRSLRAETHADDLYAALDKVADEMTEELKSFKDKRTSLIKRGGAKLKEMIKMFYGTK